MLLDDLIMENLKVLRVARSSRVPNRGVQHGRFPFVVPNSIEFRTCWIWQLFNDVRARRSFRLGVSWILKVRPHSFPSEPITNSPARAIEKPMFERALCAF